MTLRRNAVWAFAMLFAVLGAFRLGMQAATDDAGKLNLSGDIALWTVAIKPDKTADYEKVLIRVRDALQKSEDPQRKQQAAGWRVMRVSQPLPDGNVAYVHVISPVVTGADYTLLKAIYDQFPADSQTMYETYRNAFVKNLALASGDFVIDMSKPQP